jgi:hypothetical protein
MNLATLTAPDNRKYAVLTTLPKAAMDSAMAAAGKRYSDAKNEYQRIMGTATPAVVGTNYEVTFGKHRGVSGKLIWSGQTKWGTRYALATSNEKLANGRYRDVVYVRPKWTRTVDAARDARLSELSEVMAKIEAYRETAYETELLRLYREAAAAWGVSEPVMFKRVIEVVEERVASIKEYDGRNCENHWACDGPAYNQVLQQSEISAKQVKNYEKITALLTKEVAKNGN